MPVSCKFTLGQELIYIALHYNGNGNPVVATFSHETNSRDSIPECGWGNRQPSD